MGAFEEMEGEERRGIGGAPLEELHHPVHADDIPPPGFLVPDFPHALRGDGGENGLVELGIGEPRGGLHQEFIAVLLQPVEEKGRPPGMEEGPPVGAVDSIEHGKHGGARPMPAAVVLGCPEAPLRQGPGLRHGLRIQMVIAEGLGGQPEEVHLPRRAPPADGAGGIVQHERIVLPGLENPILPGRLLAAQAAQEGSHPHGEGDGIGVVVGQDIPT